MYVKLIQNTFLSIIRTPWKKVVKKWSYFIKLHTQKKLYQLIFKKQIA